MLAYVGALSAA